MYVNRVHCRPRAGETSIAIPGEIRPHPANISPGHVYPAWPGRFTYPSIRHGVCVRPSGAGGAGRRRVFRGAARHDTLRFAQATLEAFGQQLTQSQQRFEVGLIAITDVEEAQAGFDLARAQVIEAENDLDNTREALREITGEYHTDLATLSSAIPLTVPQPDDIDRWTETALANNLELASARHASETARDEIKRVSAGHLPSVDLVGRHGRDNSNGGTVGGSRTWNSSLTLQLNIPIYAGGSIVSRTRESRHLYQQSLDDLESLRRSTQRATRNAFLACSRGSPGSTPCARRYAHPSPRSQPLKPVSRSVPVPPVRRSRCATKSISLQARFFGGTLSIHPRRAAPQASRGHPDRGRSGSGEQLARLSIQSTVEDKDD